MNDIIKLLKSNLPFINRFNSPQTVLTWDACWALLCSSFGLAPWSCYLGQVRPQESLHSSGDDWISDTMRNLSHLAGSLDLLPVQVNNLIKHNCQGPNYINQQNFEWISTAEKCGYYFTLWEGPLIKKLYWS